MFYLLQIDYNEEDGTVTVTFDDTPAGEEPFSNIVVEVENPDDTPVSVSDVELKACVEEGKDSAIEYSQLDLVKNNVSTG